MRPRLVGLAAGLDALVGVLITAGFFALVDVGAALLLVAGLRRGLAESVAAGLLEVGNGQAAWGVNVVLVTGVSTTASSTTASSTTAS